MRRLSFVILASVLVASFGCAKMTANMTVGVAKVAAPALEQEGDYELAEAAAPGNLKFLEGLAHVTPDNPDLLELLARGWASYAFAFLEDRANEAREAGDDKKSEALIERAVGLYERAGRYGLKLLGQKRGFDDAWKKGGSALDQRLLDFSKDEAGQLFWTAYAWVGAINLAQDRVENLTLLPKVIKLVERVARVHEGYFFGGAHMILGGYYMSLPKLLGGKPEKAREHFERALALSQGKILLVKVVYAHLYAARTGDKALFQKLLKEVMDAPPDFFPEARLPNVLAKRKAARLLKRTEDLF
jgi:tetratricopeptide (TPR) repeat protein